MNKANVEPRNTKWQSGSVINIVLQWNPTRNYLTFIRSHHLYSTIQLPIVELVSLMNFFNNELFPLPINFYLYNGQ